MKSRLPITFTRKFFILPVIFFATISCSSTKKGMHEAEVLEKGGLSQEAFAKYSYIYENYSDAEARVGMKRVAQQILSTKSQKAQMLCLSENFEAAFAAYEDALAFYHQNHSLELNQAGDLNSSFQECKNRYIDKLYIEAEDLVKNDEFEKANVLIRKIYAVNRNDERAHFLETMCEILPNYNAGNIAYDKGMFRDAFIYFDEVCRIDAGFRDAKRLRDLCLAQGTYSLVYRITENRNVNDLREEALAASIKGKLLSQGNPFMELLERDDIDVILKEQMETMSPEYEMEGGAESGKLKRAGFILSGEIINLDYKVTPETQSKCDCYAAYRIYSDKVNCYQYAQSTSLKATFKYKLIDAETGKLYLSDLLTFADEDQGKHYSYEIMKKLSLTSPTGTRDHDVNLSNLQQPQTDPLLSEQEMLNKMNDYFSMKIANAMSSFKP